MFHVAMPMRSTLITITVPWVDEDDFKMYCPPQSWVRPAIWRGASGSILKKSKGSMGLCWFSFPFLHCRCLFLASIHLRLQQTDSNCTLNMTETFLVHHR
ncbi:hypothetical protein HHX47_DHR4001073 [Lentinula edodes]|nr:hypothetical protein HHX47_DHR4001073 [Lentinula edodes]